MADNRIFERFHARFPVKLKHSRQDFGTDVFLRDASAQGARINSRVQMFLNDSVSLEVKLSDELNLLTLNGRVVWTRNISPTLWDVGLEFHKIDFMKTQRMFNMVAALD